MFFSSHSRSINAQERGSETKACLVFRLEDTLPESVEIMTFNTGCFDAIASRLLEGLPFVRAQDARRFEEGRFGGN